MSGDEDKILHGLYYAREMIGEKLTYSGNQIWWLTTQSFARGAEWTKGGYAKSVDPAEDLNGPRYNETRFNLVTAQQERPLRLLVANGLIEWRNHDLVKALTGRPGTQLKWPSPMPVRSARGAFIRGGAGAAFGTKSTKVDCCLLWAPPQSPPRDSWLTTSGNRASRRASSPVAPH